MSRVSSVVPYALIAACLGLIFFILSKLIVLCHGDGNEYYALYFAWADTLRPWMSEPSYRSFQHFVGSLEVGSLVSAERLAETFFALKVELTQDFNHFWLYSFLAFFLSKTLDYIGITLSVHHSFLFLHYTLLLGVFSIVFYLYRWRGLAIVVVMTLLSPMLWYMDKVHTELFTFAFTLLAVVFVYRRLYLAGAACLAIASAQNPSFALVAFVPFFYRVAILRKTPFSFSEVVLAISTSLVVLLHPSYYFFRHGVPTPQLLAGGASLGDNASTFYIWLIDPDIGLLPHWPLGIVIILLAFFARASNGRRESCEGQYFYLFFAAFFLLVSLYANSSTQNLNSGATPGPARYALWYIPLFFPIAYYAITRLSPRKWFLPVCVTAILSLGWLNFALYNPLAKESVATPSYISEFIQTHFSSFYMPPAEVFAEKYSGFSENTYSIQAVLGPDCSKVLLYPGGGRAQVTAPAKCFLDNLKLREITGNYIKEHQGTDPFYARINSAELEAAGIQLHSGEYQVGQGRNGNYILADGWNGLEPFGVWSSSEKATLILPCNKRQFYFGRDGLNLKLVVQPFGKQDLTVKHQGQVVFRGTLSGPGEINIGMKPKSCEAASLGLDIYISDPRSPFELGQSSDPRKLGIALQRYSLN